MDPLTAFAGGITILSLAGTVNASLRKLENLRHERLFALQNELAGLQIVLRSLPPSNDSKIDPTLLKILKQITELMDRLQSLVSDLLKDKMWQMRDLLHKQSKEIAELREMLRSARLSLITCVSIATTSQHSNIASQIETIAIAFDEHQRKIPEPTQMPAIDRGESSKQLLSSHVIQQRSASELLDSLISAKQTELTCPGLKETWIKSPNRFKQLCGIFSIRVRSAQCSQHSCQSPRHSTRLTFSCMLPSWLLHRVCLVVYESGRRNFTINLRLGRVLHTPASSIRDYLDDVEGLRHLMSEVLISPTDVDECGRSLLWHAVNLQKLDACAFLLARGADPLFESPITGESPILAAWDLVSKLKDLQPDQALRLVDLFSAFNELDQTAFITSRTTSSASPETKLPSSLETKDQLCRRTEEDGNEMDIFYDASSEQVNLSKDQDRDYETGYETDIFYDAVSEQATLCEGKEMEVEVDLHKDDEHLHFPHQLDLSVISALDTNGRTILFGAASMDNSKAVMALISYGANVNVADVRGWTPLHIAAHEGNLKAMKALLQFTRKPQTRDGSVSSTQDTNISSLELKSNINLRDNGGRTALTIAIRSEQTEAALLLIEHGADIDLRDYYGRSPLFHAVVYNNSSMIEHLVSRKCEVSTIDSQGDTILHTAASYSTSSTLYILVHMLLKYIPAQHLPGVDTLNSQGQTAFECAQHAYNDEYQQRKVFSLDQVQRQLQRISNKQTKSRETSSHWSTGLKSMSSKNTVALTTNLILTIVLVDSTRELIESSASKDLEVYHADSLRVGKNINRAYLIVWFMFAWLVFVHSILVPLRTSFFWMRMRGFFKRSVMKPPLPGMIRVQWFCKCGQYLVDDFVELKPGAARRLEQSLRNGTANEPTIDLAHRDGATQKPSQPASSQSSAGSPPVGLTTSAASSSMPMGRPAGTNQQSQGSQLGIQQIAAPQPANHVVPQLEQRWFLMCSKPHRLPTSLTQLQALRIINDKAFFNHLRNAYYSQKSSWYSWLSLKDVASIKFVRFSVHNRQFVDIHLPVPSLPPESEKDNYHYVPYDPELLPPIGEERMSHLFHHPEHADDRAEIIEQTPKKRNKQINVNDVPSLRQGWGIQIIESVVIERLFFTSVIVFVGGSLVFGICWSVLEHDIGGAWTVSTFICGLGAILVAFGQYLVS